jgi:hypothetical protein
LLHLALRPPRWVNTTPQTSSTSALTSSVDQHALLLGDPDPQQFGLCPDMISMSLTRF